MFANLQTRVGFMGIQKIDNLFDLSLLRRIDNGSRSSRKFFGSSSFVFTLLLLIALVMSAVVILRDSGVVPAWPMDQAFVEAADLRISRVNGSWVFHYPDLQDSGGITSKLIAGFYKLIVPTTSQNLNWHIRILAMVMYLVSGALLTQSFLKNTSVRLVSLALIACSGYQFVQPSSELFAASLLCLFLICIVNRFPVWFASLLLVGYGFGKVELVLSSLVLAVFWMWIERNDPSRRFMIPVSFLFWFATLLLPSIRVNGWQTLSGSRSWPAFAPKYTSLFHPHQINPPNNDPWGYSNQTIDIIFPKSEHKVINVILRYPRLYLDYFILSLNQSILNILAATKLLILPAIFWFASPRLPLSPRMKVASIALLIVCFFGLFPATLLGFIHIRYVMRYYPLIVVVLLGLFLDEHQEKKWIYNATWIAAIGTLILQLIFLPEVISQSHYL